MVLFPLLQQQLVWKAMLLAMVRFVRLAMARFVHLD
jgi:hypothetical protein